LQRCSLTIWNGQNREVPKTLDFRDFNFKNAEIFCGS
jgi:hypothetical protein